MHMTGCCKAKVQLNVKHVHFSINKPTLNTTVTHFEIITIFITLVENNWGCLHLHTAPTYISCD